MLKRSKPSGRVREMVPIPDELKCSMCSELMKDAVIIQCCGESFCDDCKLFCYIVTQIIIIIIIIIRY